MSVGFYADHTDKPAMEAMEMAVRRLDSGSEDKRVENTNEVGAAVSAYDQFRTWALLWKNEGGRPTDEAQFLSDNLSAGISAAPETRTFSDLTPLQDTGWGMYSPSFPLEFSDFTFIPDDYIQ